uniref:C2H2-type domain-containing protein n=1 Tax=Apis cerana TaxID=7461 RepID=V9ICQ7_APICE
MVKGNTSMALESNGNNVVWLNTTRPDQIQQSQPIEQPVKCSMFTQTEQTNSFTQTEQSNSSYGDQRQQQAAMFDPQQIQQQQAAQGQQSQQQQSQQMYVTTDKKEDKSQQQSATADFPFYYNVNMLQKVQTNAMSTIGAITTDDKGCYRFDVQPVGYNTLLNQMSIAAATNATFKCDICGLVFGHMSLLNHHKRIHNTTPSNLQQQPQQVVVQTPTTVTVATTPERPYTCDVCGACFVIT